MWRTSHIGNFTRHASSAPRDGCAAVAAAQGSALRGASVYPIVRPTSAPMPSKKFPGRFRPELEVLEWRQLGGNQPAQIEPPKGGSDTTTKQIGRRVVPVTVEEELDDEIP